MCYCYPVRVRDIPITMGAWLDRICKLYFKFMIPLEEGVKITCILCIHISTMYFSSTMFITHTKRDIYWLDIDRIQTIPQEKVFVIRNPVTKIYLESLRKNECIALLVFTPGYQYFNAIIKLTVWASLVGHYTEVKGHKCELITLKPIIL